MHIGKSLWVVAGLIASLAAPMLVAQGVIFSSGDEVISGGRTGEPYTATFKTTRVQMLTNGTKITHETLVKEVRDSAGKTYRESHQELPGGDNSRDFANVVVFDPVNRTNIIWNSLSKQATIFHLPDPQQPRSIPMIAPKVQANVQPNNSIPDPAPQVEDLGTQTINGVTANGRRVTRVIPAGRQGNDQPITITNETWRSPEYGLTVRHVQDDPRTGTITTELTDFQQGEPDPKLFQVPEGYTVKEQFPQQNQN